MPYLESVQGPIDKKTRLPIDKDEWTSATIEEVEVEKVTEQPVGQPGVALTPLQQEAIDKVKAWGEDVRHIYKKIDLGPMSRWSGIPEDKLLALMDKFEADINSGDLKLQINRSFGYKECYREANEESASYTGILEDGVMRNQFETRTSGGWIEPIKGGMRDKWESNIFGKVYQENEDYKNLRNDDYFPSDVASERPLYGYINTMANPDIDKRYGEVTFVMKPEVSDRVTFGLGDSDSISAGRAEDGAVFTKEHPVKLIDRIIATSRNRPDLKEYVDDLLAGKSFDDLRTHPYVEVQFHGGIDIARDVEKIKIPKRGYDFVKNIGKKYNILVEYK
jgi:hypothetical protein